MGSANLKAVKNEGKEVYISLNLDQVNEINESAARIKAILDILRQDPEELELNKDTFPELAWIAFDEVEKIHKTINGEKEV